jgi:peptide subunit release factor 1 (eRF1)
MSLARDLDLLAAFEPTDLPVISLYLDGRPDQRGRPTYEAFVRKELRGRARTFPLRSPERESFDRDAERIQRYLRDEVRPSANGIAIFACAGADGFFHPLQVDAPIEAHRLYVYHQPHLYPLARLDDRYRPYAVLLADTNSARVLVFGVGTRLGGATLEGQKVSRVAVGGWAQARYQRHVENYHLHHAKEVVDALDRVVREERIERVVLAGDEVIVPLLRQQLPAHLADRVVDVLRLDMTTPERDVFRATLDAMREHDARDDRRRVSDLLDAYRAGGLAVVGAHDTLAALRQGQVDELLLSAGLEAIHEGPEEIGAPLLSEAPVPEPEAGRSTRIAFVADALVTRARQTGARIVFIEDAALLAAVGGVGATLRYRS